MSDRYGRRYSTTETELDLISSFHCFGPHESNLSGPPQTHETIEPLRRGTNWKSFLTPFLEAKSRSSLVSTQAFQPAEPSKPLLPSDDARLEPRKRRKLWARFHGGWRTGVALGALGAIIALIINVCLLIWIKAKYHVPNDGAAIVFEGSCSQKTKISVWCHLAINVCSTLLLTASNNAMQVLSAPTRADVDKAHTRKLWLDVGITSIKNLRIAIWQRVTLWSILLLSSIPLHLL